MDHVALHSHDGECVLSFCGPSVPPSGIYPSLPAFSLPAKALVHSIILACPVERFGRVRSRKPVTIAQSMPKDEHRVRRCRAHPRSQAGLWHPARGGPRETAATRHTEQREAFPLASQNRTRERHDEGRRIDQIADRVHALSAPRPGRPGRPGPGSRNGWRAVDGAENPTGHSCAYITCGSGHRDTASDRLRREGTGALSAAAAGSAGLRAGECGDARRGACWAGASAGSAQALLVAGCAGTAGGATWPGRPGVARLYRHACMHAVPMSPTSPALLSAASPPPPPPPPPAPAPAPASAAPPRRLLPAHAARPL